MKRQASKQWKQEQCNDSQELESEYIKQPVLTVDGQMFIKTYRKQQMVGSGSYSSCYLVESVDSGSIYVAKIIPKKKLQILQRQKVFVRSMQLYYQIKIHQSLSHRNVVQLDHWFEDQKCQYMLMEYCSQGNLQERLRKTGRIQERQIKRYVFQITHAIAYIHEQNILHRDLKLCNFYLDQKDEVKLGDFGFACQLANENDRKRETCGTPNYIAPEAISGFGYSFSSDIWAIGIILFRMKFGFCPFQGATVKITLQNVKTCKLDWPKAPAISPQLKDLITQILNLNYDDRLTSQAILNHKFFEDADAIIEEHRKNQLKQSGHSHKFSFAGLFTSKQKKRADSVGAQKKQKKGVGKEPCQKTQRRKSILERQSRNPAQQIDSQKDSRRESKNSSQNEKKEELKKYSSCQALRQIKQIFKSKSKQNLATGASSNAGIQTYSSLNTLNTIVTNRDNHNQTNFQSSKHYELLNLNFMDTVERDNKEGADRTKKLNQFIKKQANTITLKQQLKNQKKQALKGQGNKPLAINLQKKEQNPEHHLSHHQGLFILSNKYYLPIKVQQEKDIIILHMKNSVKQVIHGEESFLMHKNAQKLYKLTGQPLDPSHLHKVVRYIIENKVSPDEYESNEQIIMRRVIQFVAKKWIVKKEGIILRYENESIIVSKLITQESFHVWDLLKSGTSSLFMYTIPQKNRFQFFDGIVVMRIYTGWVKNILKN